MSINYKGYEITSASQNRPEHGDWTVRVSITNKQSLPVSKTFDAAQTFKTQAEADSYSLEFGKQIVDGKYQELSVPN